MPATTLRVVRDDILLVRPADITQYLDLGTWTTLRTFEGHAIPCFGLINGESMEVTPEIRPGMPPTISVPNECYAALVLRGNQLYAIGPEILLRDYRTPASVAARLRQQGCTGAQPSALDDATRIVLQRMGVPPAEIIERNDHEIRTMRGTILLGTGGFATWSRGPAMRTTPERVIEASDVFDVQYATSAQRRSA